MMKRELSYDLICISVFGSEIEKKTDGGVKLIRFIQRTLRRSHLLGFIRSGKKMLEGYRTVFYIREENGLIGFGVY